MARVVVDVMLKPEILDPQGEAIVNALPRLGVTGVSSVRVGNTYASMQGCRRPEAERVLLALSPSWPNTPTVRVLGHTAA